MKCSLCVCDGTCHSVVTTSLAPRWLTIKGVLSAEAGLMRMVPVRTVHPVRKVGGGGMLGCGDPKGGDSTSRGRTVQDTCRLGQLGALPHSVSMPPGPGGVEDGYAKPEGAQGPEWRPFALRRLSSSRSKTGLLFGKAGSTQEFG